MAYLGIDLGTTNSVAVIYKDKNDELEIVKVDGEEEILPSVVYFGEDEVIIGREAKEGVVIYPEETIVEVKRDMGTDTVYNVEGKNYSPEDISAHILRKLKQAAEEQAGEKFDQVVITHPAYFNDRQIYATKKAGELAGFSVVHLLSEPLAAAIEYGFKQDYAQTLLIYDFGGGTFDACVLKVSKDAYGNEIYNELSDVGDMELGGRDFDDILIKYMIQDFQFKNTIKLEDLDNETYLRTRQRLKKEAELIKTKLSSTQKAEVRITPLIVEDGVPYNLVMDITREQFEALIREKVDKSREIIEEALNRAKLEADDISKVILVGGTTLVPMIQRMVSGYIKEPYRATDPAKSVAMGAAIYNYLIHLPNSNVKVGQITRMVFGTEAISNIDTLEKTLVPIIPMGTPIPTKISDNQFKSMEGASAVAVDVFQWEQGKDELRKYIGTVVLEGIKGDSQIEVTYSINENNLFEVYVKDINTGKEEKAEIDRSKSKPAPERKIIPKTVQASNVVFIIDTTGSMDIFIEGVKDRAIEFAKILTERKNKFQLALIGFGDLGEREKPKIYKFTDDIKKFQKSVTKLPRNYGGDIPESSLDAVETAIDLVDKSTLLDDSQTIFILITDAPPHTPTKRGNDSDAIAELLKKRNITTYVVARKDSDSVNAYTPLTKLDGKYYSMKDSFNDILDNIAHSIVELVRI